MPNYCSSSDLKYFPVTESLLEQPSGSYRVKYQGAGEYASHDFTLEAEHRPVDVSLVLPHYRARNQPLDHRLSMYVGSEQGESIKVKVCRNFTPTRTAKFHLEVYSPTDADITIWLPSDFKGHIHRSAHCKKTSFSSGFTNRIMQNALLTQTRRPSVISMGSRSIHHFTDLYVSAGTPLYSEKENMGLTSGSFDDDEVVVYTGGHVTFRMWDIHRGMPEARCREACKRVFGLGWCVKRAPEVTMDWDFLLEE